MVAATVLTVCVYAVKCNCACAVYNNVKKYSVNMVLYSALNLVDIVLVQDMDSLC